MIETLGSWIGNGLGLVMLGVGVSIGVALVIFGGVSLVRFALHPVPAV